MVTIGKGVEVSDETYEAMKKCAEMIGGAGFTRKELGRRLRKIASESAMSLKDVTNEVVSQAALKAVWGENKMTISIGERIKITDEIVKAVDEVARLIDCDATLKRDDGKLESPDQITGSTEICQLKGLAGHGFISSVLSAVKIRIDRRAQYKDTYRYDDLLHLFYQMKNKLKRVKLQIHLEDGKDFLTPAGKETALDSLRDLICYAAFAIENIEAGRYGT